MGSILFHRTGHRDAGKRFFYEDSIDGLHEETMSKKPDKCISRLKSKEVAKASIKGDRPWDAIMLPRELSNREKASSSSLY